MPDLTELVAPVCQTVLDFQTEVAGHRVSYGGTQSGRYRYNWGCDCTEFKARAGCEHVDAAKAQRCNWNKYMDPRPIPEGYCCPDCGGPLSYVKVAV